MKSISIDQNVERILRVLGQIMSQEKIVDGRTIHDQTIELQLILVFASNKVERETNCRKSDR